MPEDKQKFKTPHNLILENRKTLSLSGVNEVDSFDEESVVILTDYGELNIKGNNLNISKLNLESGEVSIEGTISTLIYTDNRPAGGFMSRLFR